MAQYFFVQNADENECFYSGIRVVNISDEMQIQPQSRLILAEPTVIAENQMQYVYQQRPNTQQVAQPQQTQYVLQEDDIVTDSFTSHQIYVSTDGSANIQRQLQHTGLVQQSPEPQAQQVIIQQPQTNRVILQSSPTQPVIVHQPTVQAQNPVVLNNRAPQQSPMQQQQRIIYDSTRQPPVYTITTPQPQMQAQPRPMQQNIIVRQQAPQMQRQQIRMQQPTLTYQRAQTPTTVIQNRATVAQTRASLSQPRHTTTTPVRHRYRAPTTVTTPRAQVAAPRVTRPVRYASVTTPQQPRPPRVLNSGLIRMSQPEQRQASFSGSIPTTTRMLTPLGKVNRTYPNIQQKPQTAVATQPSTTSKLEVRNIVPTSQSSNDPNGDLEESITASILEKSQITVNHTEESTTSDEQFSSQESTYSSVSNGSSIDLKQRKVMKAGEAVRGGRGRGQVAQRPAVKRPVNQSVQDLFNSMSTDVEQTNQQQQQQQQQMLLTQSSPECETRESAKMLVILQCGEQRLITFTLPKESCTVQELLEQVGVPFTPDTNIQCVSNPGANIDYVVTVGDPVQDNVSNEIVMRTENNVEQLQQQFQQPVQQQQQQQQIQQQQQQQPTMQPPLQQQQQRSPIRPQQGQFVTSTPISQRQQSFGAATQQPQLTPIKAAPPPTPEPPPEPPKPPAVERKIIQGWLALCSNCGFCGIDHAKCERCHHILGDTYKRIPCSQPKPTPTTQSAPIRTQIPALALPAQSKIQKQFVRIAKEPIAMQKKVELVPKRPVPELTRTISSSSSLSNNSMNSSATSSTASAVPKNTTMPVLKVTESSSAAKARTAAVRNRTRATKTEEPIILTLSSDDEEETPKPKPKPKKSVSTKTEEIKALACEPAIPEMESPIKGNERLCITDLTDVPDKLLTSIQCRTIRIGTLHYEPKEQVIFSSRGVRIIAPNVRNAKENIILDVQIKEIVKIIAHFGKMLPILFIYTSPSCAEYIRNSLDMASNASKGPYFDPCTHKHEAVRRITILAEVITDETKSVIKSLYSVTELEEISYKDASELYKRSTMKIDQMANTSSASADEGGSGNSDDVHQILIYPQGKGGISINTEDYKCLAIDQYLNDVIIDFYLNYLRLSVFTEEQRDKTHIFSSFFYKRLTAMSTRQRQMEKDLKMTASQKRHHRVKGWTKSVNLFDKEFIIIPINEQSHWFLAIICFPGLKGPQTYDGGIPVKVAPTPKKRASKDGERKVSVTIGNTTITPLTKKEEAIFLNDDSASERDEAEADESDMESEESEPEVEPGHQAIKQPCILIFDSLAGGYRSRVVATLRDYLTCEYKAKVCPTSVHTFNKTNMPGHTVKVPQQNNFTDCGLYLLQYVEEFFSNPIRDYRLPVKQIQNWFTTLAVTKKREDISNLLKDLVKEMHPERLDLLPDITFPTQDGKLIETEENFEEAAEFEEEELDDPNYEMDDEDLTEEESPEKKNGKKLLKRSFEKTDKSSPDKKIARTN